MQVKTSWQVEKSLLLTQAECDDFYLAGILRRGFLFQKRVLFCFLEAMFNYRMVLIGAGRTEGKFWRRECWY